jgi:hypothetical protein
MIPWPSLLSLLFPQRPRHLPKPSSMTLPRPTLPASPLGPILIATQLRAPFPLHFITLMQWTRLLRVAAWIMIAIVLRKAVSSPPLASHHMLEMNQELRLRRLANYTSRVTDTKLSTVERQKALKWIVHFVGDIHQPLHDENLEIGGNNINVTFDGTARNLHSIVNPLCQICYSFFLIISVGYIYARKTYRWLQSHGCQKLGW